MKTDGGKVFLVGAGPGDPGLLTCKALRLLEEADVVLHDDLVGDEILALIPQATRKHNVGKRCGRKNIQHAVRYTEMAPNRFKDFWRN